MPDSPELYPGTFRATLEFDHLSLDRIDKAGHPLTAKLYCKVQLSLHHHRACKRCEGWAHSSRLGSAVQR
ncbi:hypothetical protein [Erythrobacter sp. SD-21]|uniref:hypothetical protein n=1 Tax=Erythrobacter sp. SD-21 TaxID=161528 RepID=UPI000153FDF8|nr:hypothetical protein [Erythrobacter sp. SD-21]EDL50369.1 hypothetical protein ED21_27898 [Erythrobacter sp. SD-21]